MQQELQEQDKKQKEILEMKKEKNLLDFLAQIGDMAEKNQDELMEKLLAKEMENLGKENEEILKQNIIDIDLGNSDKKEEDLEVKENVEISEFKNSKLFCY